MKFTIRKKKIPVDRIEDPGLVSLLAYWDSKRRGRCCPARPDIDPLEIKKLLPQLFLVDVHGEPPVFRYRLVGTEIVQRYGRNDTGETLDAISDATMRETVRRQYLAAIEICGPICHHNRFVFADYRILEYRRLLLPLSPDAENINMLLGGVHYISVKGDPPAAK